MTLRWHLVRIILLFATVAIGSLHTSAADNPTDQELAARELPAVVSISILRAPSAVTGTVVAGATGPAEHSEAPRGRRFLGSGFIIDPSGIIVTNRHVIEGATDILVTLQDNTLLRAQLVAQADQLDVALIKVTPDSPLPTVRFGDSDTVRVADHVLAIGNPLGLGGSVTQGIVSALNRDIRDTPFDDYIQTDAAINHGNSGGPLFNERGEVIGMNTAIFSPEATSGSIGLGFAIPSNDVKYVADALRSPDGMRVGNARFPHPAGHPGNRGCAEHTEGRGRDRRRHDGGRRCQQVRDRGRRHHPALRQHAGEGSAGAGACDRTNETRHCRRPAHLAQRRTDRRDGDGPEAARPVSCGAVAARLPLARAGVWRR